MSKKRGLGRGLEALIPGGGPLEGGDEAGLKTVPIDAIGPNPHQPRADFKEEELAELARSISEHGLIQPLIVTQNDGRYTLIAGERRWRAARRAGLSTLPVIVKEASSQEMLELALIENIQRADLNPLEEALAYQQLTAEFGLTQEQVAQRVGRSRPAVANTLRLLNLPATVQQAVVDGRLSGAHARTLLPLPTPEQQTAVMNSILNQGLNVRQTEALVRKLLAGAKPKPKPASRPSPELTELESRFGQSLGTRVNVQKQGSKGKVIIHFYSDEELQAIYDAIVRE